MRHLRVQCRTLEALPGRLSPYLIRPRVSNCRCGLALGIEQGYFARAEGIFSTLPLLKIGICSVPLRDFPRSVAQRTTAKEKPAKFAVEAAEAALSYVRLYRIQSFPECFQNSWQVVWMNRNLPS